MNFPFLGAGVMSGLLFLAHVFGGAPDILEPILGTDLPPEIRAVAVVVWHGISAVLIINAALLIGAGFGAEWVRHVVWVVGLQYAGFTLLFLVVGISRLGNLFDMPQWIGFLAVLALMGLGHRLAVKKGNAA